MARISLFLFAVVMGLLLLHGNIANGANVIGQFDASFGLGYHEQPPAGYFYIVFQHDSDEERFVARRPSLFEDIEVTPQTVGQQFYVDESIDSDFPEIVEHLTNGIDEVIQIWHFQGPGITGSGTAFPRRESAYLGASGNPDLVGQNIRAMVMTVIDFQHDVIHPISGRSDFVDVAITVIGVPEPSSLGLLSVGVAALICRPGRKVPEIGSLRGVC
jgi:hypothetical protein